MAEWPSGWGAVAVKYCDPVNLFVSVLRIDDDEEKIIGRTKSWTRMTFKEGTE